MTEVILTLIFGVLSGTFWAVHEMINHHWNIFSIKHPKLNPIFWNPEISWKNKYKQGNPDLGRNSKLVWFSDAKHLLASLTQICLLAGGVTIGHIFGPLTLICLGVFVVSYVISNFIVYK